MIALFLVVPHGISLTKSQEGGHIVNNKTQTSTLDQIFTSDSDIIKQITSGPLLRGSDHLTATQEGKLYDNVEDLGCSPFDRKIRLGCRKHYGKHIPVYRRNAKSVRV